VKELDQATSEALRQLVQKRLLLEAILEEKQAAAYSRQVQGGRAIEGIGQHTMAIAQGEYYKAQMHYGRQCWEDKSFRDYYLRKTPEARVKSKGTRFQVGWRCPGPGLEPVWQGSVREVKKYPENNASD